MKHRFRNCYKNVSKFKKLLSTERGLYAESHEEYKLTAYCGCKKCSGKWGTRTASGKKAKQGRTIAVDRRKIKLGTKVKIKGKTYVAEDVGGGVKGKHIDVFFSSHKQTMKFGKKKGVKVYKVK